MSSARYLPIRLSGINNIFFKPSLANLAAIAGLIFVPCLMATLLVEASIRSSCNLETLIFFGSNGISQFSDLDDFLQFINS